MRNILIVISLLSTVICRKHHDDHDVKQKYLRSRDSRRIQSIQSNKDQDTNKIKNCPVSSKFSLKTDGQFTYPIDVLNETNLIGQEIIKCSTSWHGQTIPWGGDEMHNCTTQLLYCPLQDKFIDIALTNDKYEDNDFCALHNALNTESETIRVVVLGGSVTTGEHTDGACCTKKYNNETECIEPILCKSKWIDYFTFWLQSITKSKVVLHMLAHGGTTSEWAGEYIYEMMEREKIPPLTSKDLIFVDYSVNDHVKFVTPSAALDQLVDLSAKLMRHSSSQSSLSGKPHLIYLAQYSQAGRHSTPYDIYHEAASIFNASFWSYNDVVYSEYTMNPKSELLFDFLRTRIVTHHTNKRNDYNFHPTWFGHLFMADLYASLLLKKLSVCENRKQSRQVQVDHSWTIPTPQNVVSKGCGDGRTILYSANAEQAFYKKNTSVVTYHAQPSDSWKLAEDRHNKPGWIITTHMQNNNTGNLSFIVPKQVIMKSEFFRIAFLRTYEHVGTAEVVICGKHLVTVDGLWKNPKINKVSLSYTRTVAIGNEIKTACGSFQSNRKDDMLDVTLISPTFLPLDDPKPYRRRQRRLDAERDHISATTVSYDNRGKAKFKLLGVELC